MRFTTTTPGSDPSAVLYNRCTVSLGDGTITMEEIPCRNLEEVLGGFGRSFQMLATRPVQQAYTPENPLILNTGLLTGSNVMTGLRSYFSAYSPLKQSRKGLPAAMWSAASGKFGSKLKWTGIDEVVFEGRADEPVYAVFRAGANGPEAELKPAGHLLGLSSHDKIMALQKEYPEAHFAAIGPAGERYREVLMGAVALSTENQLKSGEDKCRFAGRGGMGSLMGYKNLVAIVAQSEDRLPPIAAEMRDVNRDVVKGGGSNRFQPLTQGGGGGTWANLEVLDVFKAVPENNFRSIAGKRIEGLYRDSVDKSLHVRSEACFRCGVRCHNNLYRKNEDGSAGEFIAKFDFEPLNLFGTNLGIHNGEQVAELIRLCDNLAMDAISLGSTIAYVLDYNARHPEDTILNGATFGDYDKVRELVLATGNGNCDRIGHGVQRLSTQLGETGYAMQVKGLELPAYLPETNPGYAFAIAGGHMSMGTHMMVAREGKVGLNDWVHAITQQGLLQVGYDMIGLCKFVGLGLGHDFVVRAVKAATGLEVTSAEIVAAVRRAYLRGLALELRQGYQDDEYTLPQQVFSDPNPNITLPRFVTQEFLDEMKKRVWDAFEPEMAGLFA
ncbi:aldehyde:ferredoxin oxidoreductase [Geomonas oryzisoli]|uniref:Aldehyde:ferredoxin oxidoreductase n=1 Tax=Geomonas oryzisoli TaxID=2847992 RepID=A0ABX8JAB4_9BACT|nr:aldehyde ferredoxin oxidoreductase C-terminal domain-containing protein [Geomonas oryzisoli]QWV95300.1 aldehyde:ferredoxin oxidoreductase [Geomonas oryzisoli]